MSKSLVMRSVEGQSPGGCILLRIMTIHAQLRHRIQVRRDGVNKKRIRNSPASVISNLAVGHAADGVEDIELIKFDGHEQNIVK